MQAVVFTALGPVMLFTCLKFRCTQKEHGAKDDSIYPVAQGMACFIRILYFSGDIKGIKVSSLRRT